MPNDLPKRLWCRAYYESKFGVTNLYLPLDLSKYEKYGISLNNVIFEGFEYGLNFEGRPIVQKVNGGKQVYAYIEKNKRFEMNFPRWAKKIEEIISLNIILTQSALTKYQI